jgi:hypothetical protein
LASLRLPALLGFLAILPFLVMELVNRRQYVEPFPFVLFALLWLEGILFVLIARPLVAGFRAGNMLKTEPIRLVLSVLALVFLAWQFIAFVADQMPCFLGVPNCD